MATELPSIDEIVIDKNKQPVSVNVDSNHFLGGNENEVNTIWAEKADYLNEENLGEGLQNKPVIKLDEKGHPVGGYNKESGDYEYDLTYKLSIAPATKETYGGIKIGGSLELDENGCLIVDVSKGLIATPNMPGVVAPSEESFKVTSSGKMTLKPATDSTLGGVKVKQNITPKYKSGLRMSDAEGKSIKDSLNVYSNYLITQLGLNTAALKSLENDGYSLDGALEILLRLYETQEKRYSTLHNLVKTYVEEKPSDGRPLIFGCDTFSKGGRRIDFEEELSDTFYSVVVKQLTMTLGDLGEFYVIKDKKGFTVYNTNENDWDMFCYLVVPSNVIYDNDFNPPKETIKYTEDSSGNLLYTEDGTPLFEKIVLSSLPVKKGSSVFNGNYLGTTVSLINLDKNDNIPFNDTNYSVIITPSTWNTSDLNDNLALSIGEVWVEEKKTDGFTVKCTGGKDNGGNIIEIPFDWIAIPHNAKYDNVYFPIHCGTINVDTDHTVIKQQSVEFPSELIDSEYKINAVGVYPSGELKFIKINVLDKNVEVIEPVADQDYNIIRDERTMLPYIFLHDLSKEYPIYNVGIEELCEHNFVDEQGKTKNVFYDKKYHVLSQLSCDLGSERGSMGEYCCDITSKTRSGFRFENSGEAKRYTLDWITVDNLPFPTIDTVAELNERIVSLEQRLAQVNMELVDQRLVQVENEQEEIKEEIEVLKSKTSSI